LSAISLAASTYVLLGMAFVATASDWPPFWPSMGLMTRPIEAFASTGMAAVGLTIVAGFSFGIGALISAAVGGYKVWGWVRGRYLIRAK
jgi:hypothetical protein